MITRNSPRKVDVGLDSTTKKFALLTTLCENVEENYMHRVTTWNESVLKRVGTISFYSALEIFVVPSTLCGKHAGITRVVRECFTQFLACKKMSKSPKLIILIP